MSAIPFTTEQLTGYDAHTFEIPSAIVDRLELLTRTRSVTLEAAAGVAWSGLVARYHNAEEVILHVMASQSRDGVQVPVRPEGTLWSAAQVLCGQLKTGGQELGAGGGITTCCWCQDAEVPGKTRADISAGDLHGRILGREEAFLAPYLFTIYYRPERFSLDGAKQMGQQFNQMLGEAVQAPDKPIGEWDLLTKEEIHRFIERHNRTQYPYPKHRTVPSLFEEQAERIPDEPAIIEEGRQFTYKELNLAANRLAHYLRKHGVQREQAVGILAERTAEMVIGILAIIKAGGAYVPIDPDHPQDRIQYLLEDSGARLVLTSAELSGRLPADAEQVPLEGTAWAEQPDHNPEPVGGAKDLIYIIYTSGSTGRPKGVMVTHRNVVRLVKNTNFVDFQAGDRILQTGSLVFDASTFEIWGSLLNGVGLVLVDKTTILDSRKLEEALRRFGITTMFLTTALFLQLIDRNPAMFKPVRQLFVGGELMSPKHFYRAAQECAPIRLSNIYGPTENTTFSTCYELKEEREGPIPIGTPLGNSTVYVVNAHGKLQPAGAIGELWVGGDGVARGYLNRDDLTEKMFIDSPFVPGERIYKTGDLVRLCEDGQLEFVGRKDHQVKIRGYRMELGEIEARIHSHSQVKETLVTDFEEAPGQKALCAYVVAEGGLDAAGLRAYLAQLLPEYMVPGYFMFLERMPLTINGKIDRAKLPRPEKQERAAVHYAAPTNETERKLAAIWEELLGIEPIGIDDHFFDLGGHSLKVAQLQARIYETFQVTLSFKLLFEMPHIRSLASLIAQLEQGGFEAIEPAPDKPHYRLAPAQQRMYALQQRTDIGMAYHVPLLYRLPGDWDPDRLEQALRKLVERHEALRTSFHWEEGEVVQRVHPAISFAMERLEADGRTAEEAAASFLRPFRMEEAPLLRAAWIRLAEGEAALLLDVHHIVFDGTSLSLLAQELAALYGGQALPAQTLHYKDYAEWQAAREIREQEAGEAYWLRMLEGELPVLELPTDFPRPPMQTFAGGIVRAALPAADAAALKKLASERGTTLYMALLAVYNLLLAAYADKEDIIVGCAVAARTHPDLERMMGMFVNTLPIRSCPEGGKSFAGYLAELKESLLAAYEYQTYPLDKLVDQLSYPRDMSRNPLFDTVFVMQNMGDTTLELDGAACEAIPYHNGTAKFDVTLEAVERKDAVLLNFEYNTALFRRDTIERLAGHFLQLVQEAIRKPEALIGELDMITEREREQIVAEFNGTEAAYPREATIHGLFEEQARRTPDRTAVTDPQRSLTYAELNAEANRLAHELRRRGVHREQAVGVLTERTAEMIVGVLAIMKAGGAYVPIDPDYPADRVDYLLEDSGAQLVLASGSLAGQLPPHIARVGFEAAATAAGSSGEEEIAIDQDRVNEAEDLAYLMYTSGSTGKPKGVMVTHRNVIRLVQNTNFVNFREDDCILQTGSLVFDASTFEIWGALLNGLRLVLVDKMTILDESALAQAIERHGVTMMWLTSPLFTQLAEKNPELFRPVRTLLVGGDVLSPKHIYRVREASDPITIINGYGPTENTTFTACYEIAGERPGSIPIGKPIANSTAYVVNAFGKLQPIGIPGELWAGGDGVARGYLNRSDLTAEKFIDSPFRPGERIYKTGDLVRWLPDGNIEFLGRKDHQVKIRGFRMELGEIEAQIRSHPQVKDVLVSVCEEAPGQKALCAHIVAEGDLTAADVRAYVLTSLPDYMAPAYYAFLERMPLTTNGKIDRSKLPEPEKLEGVSGSMAAPENGIEQKLADAWQEVLGLTAVGVEDNFFDIGGHSLKAITLVARLKQEFIVDVADIFAYPTIRQLARHIEYRPNHLQEKLARIRERYAAAPDGEAPAVEEARRRYRSGIEDRLHPEAQRRTEYRHVLLTGATGYLGAYLLHEIISCTDSEVSVIVRGRTPDEARGRLADKLAYYFGSDWFLMHAGRIHLVNGELSAERFGLGAEEYERLAGGIDCIVHAAANVKHYGRYDEFVQSNVTATERLVELALERTPKAFHHVSTMSVGMGSIEGRGEVLFTEDDGDLGQQHHNVYVKTKFEAELRIQEARARGLQASIYRVGNIVCHSDTGHFQENIADNAFYNTIKSYLGLGAVLASEPDTDLSFVNQVSAAIVTLFDKPALYNGTYHVYNPHLISLSELLAAHPGIAVKPLTAGPFFDELYARFEREENREAVESVLLHNGWMDEASGGTVFVHTAERTAALLARLGFAWTKPAETEFRRLLAHAETVGFLPQAASRE